MPQPSRLGLTRDRCSVALDRLRADEIPATTREDALAWLRSERARRRAWAREGCECDLLPPECFSDEFAPLALTLETGDPLNPEPRGARSEALADVVHRRCCGWAVRPTTAEMFHAIRALEPTDRQKSLIDAWFTEGSHVLFIDAWREHVYTDRQFVAALHRAGCARGDTPARARRIQRINAWAVVWRPTPQ